MEEQYYELRTSIVGSHGKYSHSEAVRLKIDTLQIYGVMGRILNKHKLFAKQESKPLWKEIPINGDDFNGVVDWSETYVCDLVSCQDKLCKVVF